LICGVISELDIISGEMWYVRVRRGEKAVNDCETVKERDSET